CSQLTPSDVPGGRVERRQASSYLPPKAFSKLLVPSDHANNLPLRNINIFSSNCIKRISYLQKNVYGLGSHLSGAFHRARNGRVEQSYDAEKRTDVGRVESNSLGHIVEPTTRRKITFEPVNALCDHSLKRLQLFDCLHEVK